MNEDIILTNFPQILTKSMYFPSGIILLVIWQYGESGEGGPSCVFMKDSSY